MLGLEEEQPVQVSPYGMQECCWNTCAGAAGEGKDIKIQMQKELGRTNQVPVPLGCSLELCTVEFLTLSPGQSRRVLSTASSVLPVCTGWSVLGLICLQLGCPWLETCKAMACLKE